MAVAGLRVSNFFLKLNSRVGEGWGQARNHYFSLCCRSVQGLRRKKCTQTIIGAYIRADYNLEILGQKWRALTNFLALRNCQNLGTQKNYPVLLTIGRILGTVAEKTGWLDGACGSFYFFIIHFSRRNSINYKRFFKLAESPIFFNVSNSYEETMNSTHR